MVWENLGYDQGGIGHGGYAGLSDYTDNVADVEDPKWLAKVIDAFPRTRIVDNFGVNNDANQVTYPNIQTTNTKRWLSKVKVYKPTQYVLVGVTNNLTNIVARPDLSYFTPSSYVTYKTYVLAYASWAQSNGMDAFCVINEPLISTAHSTTIGMAPTSITRTSNVATATFSYDHGLTSGDYIAVGSGSDASYRVADSESAETVQCTVTGARTMTYPSTGSDGTATGTYKVNWSAYEVVRKCISLIEDTQEVFTRGPVVATESQGHMTPWINQINLFPQNALMGLNVYGDGTAATGYSSFKSEVDTDFAAFGSRLIITEFNCVDSANHQVPPGISYASRGFEYHHAVEMAKRLAYLKSLSIAQVYYFNTTTAPLFYNTYPSNTFGDKYITGDYKPIYNVMREEKINKLFLGTGEI